MYKGVQSHIICNNNKNICRDSLHFTNCRRDKKIIIWSHCGTVYSVKMNKVCILPQYRRKKLWKDHTQRGTGRGLAV